MSLIGVIVISFSLLHFIPGDPVEIMLGEQASAEDKANLRRELGLDQSVPKQFIAYMSRLAQFDLGRSLTLRSPVAEQIVMHFPATLELSLAALSLAVLWGLPLGVLAAVQRNRSGDWLASGCALLGMSLPGVFLGPMLIFIFAIQLDLFPVSDRGGLPHLVLPAASLALPLGAVILRMTRASMLNILSEDYMRTARSKGASNFRVFFHHGLRNALIPIITILGLQLGALLTGTVITETIFDWPGIGSLLFSAVQRRDYPLVQGTLLLIATVYVVVNLLTDIAYGLVDPRIRQAHS